MGTPLERVQHFLRLWAAQPSYALALYLPPQQAPQAQQAQQGAPRERRPALQVGALLLIGGWVRLHDSFLWWDRARHNKIFMYVWPAWPRPDTTWCSRQAPGSRRFRVLQNKIPPPRALQALAVCWEAPPAGRAAAPAPAGGSGGGGAGGGRAELAVHFLDFSRPHRGREVGEGDGGGSGSSSSGTRLLAAVASILCRQGPRKLLYGASRGVELLLGAGGRGGAGGWAQGGGWAGGPSMQHTLCKARATVARSHGFQVASACPPAGLSQERSCAALGSFP